MQASERLGVVVLAAGAAVRLGRDKPTLPWGSTTLLRHVVEQFGLACVGQRVVVLNSENESRARQGLPEDVRVVVNREPKAEMLASVRLGMEALSASDGPICIHPVDVFAISRELILLLWRAWRADPKRIHLPELAGKGAHPLIIPRGLAAAIAGIPRGEGLNWLLHERPGDVVRHAWHDQRLLADIDTMEEYARYRP